jgi:hypothetical protein
MCPVWIFILCLVELEEMGRSLTYFVCSDDVGDAGVDEELVSEDEGVVGELPAHNERGGE